MSAAPDGIPGDGTKPATTLSIPLLRDAGLSLPDGVLVDNRFREMSAEQIYNQLEAEAEQGFGNEEGSDGSAEIGEGDSPAAESQTSRPLR
jgi:hypothetical protein